MSEIFCEVEKKMADDFALFDVDEKDISHQEIWIR